MKKILIVFIGLLITSALFSQTIKVAVMPDIKPIAFINANGEPDGLFINILDIIAKAEGWNVEYVEAHWSESFYNVKNDIDLDVILALTDTSERFNWFRFNKESIMMSWSQVYVNVENDKIDNILDIEGKKIGLMNGDQNGKNFTILADSFNIEYRAIYFEKYGDISEAILDGNIDAGVFFSLYGATAGLKPTNTMFNPTDSFYAVNINREDNYYILETIDKYVNEWKKDPKSDYYEIYDKWFKTLEYNVFPSWIKFLIIAVALLAIMLYMWGFLLRRLIKKRTNQLEKSEYRYKSLHDASFGGIAIHDNGLILECNKGLSDLTGYTHEELIGMNGVDFMSKETKQIVRDMIVIGYEKPYEVTLVDKSGKKIPIRVQGRNVPYHGKNVRTVEFRDITIEIENAKAMAAISKFPIENPGPVLRISYDGDIIFSNKPGILLTETCEDGECIPDNWLQVIEDVFDSGHGQELEVEAGDKTISLFFTPILEENYVNVYGRDITVRKRVEKELKEYRDHLEELIKERTEQLEEVSKQVILSEKQASLGRMVAGMAHEINTPIGVALTASSYLNEKAQTIKDRYEAELLEEEEFIHMMDENIASTSIINSNIFRAADLIRSLKEMSVDQASGNIRRINVPEYTSMILTTLQPKFKHTKFTYEMDIQDYDAVLDPSYYAQYITNLIMNSIDHGFEGREEGHIFMSIKFDEDGVCHHIYEDNGNGISKEHIDKVFEPFYTTKRGQGFTGLGCNIIYNIATEVLGGKIKVENIKEGGVRFTLVFKPDFDVIIN